jgi:hypothetical protein
MNEPLVWHELCLAKENAFMCKLEGNMFIVNFNSYNPNIPSHKFKLVWGVAVQKEMSIELWYLDSTCQRTHVVDNSFKNRFSQWNKEEEKIHLSNDFWAQSMHLHMRAIISLHRVFISKAKGWTNWASTLVWMTSGICLVLNLCGWIRQQSG